MIRPSRHSLVRRRQPASGVALITVLLLMLLLTGLGLAMTLSLNSDAIMNGYYGDYRGAFYGADAGLAAVRQEIANELPNQIIAQTATGVQPFASSGVGSTVMASVLSKFSTSSSAPVTVSSTNSWPSRFYVQSYALSEASCQGPNVGTVNYACWFTYSLTVVGRGAQNYQNALLTENGSILINVSQSTTNNSQRSFASWGTFLNKNDICLAELIGGTITGPQFTNGSWTFGSDQSYTFTDSVASQGAKAGYYFSGGCVQSATSSYTSGHTTIAPNFEAGLSLGQSSVALPTNDYNQKRAVLDATGTSATAVSNAELSATVKDASGNAYPSTGASSGVYLPYSCTANCSSSTPTYTYSGGGIYVKGDASVTLSGSSACSSTTCPEIYTITQGSGASATVTTVTINNATNTTTFSSKVGSAAAISKTLVGVPVQKITSTSGATSGSSTTTNATMLYVDGNITSLSGTTSSAAAVQDGTALTVTAAGNITVTNNLYYKTEPVTTSATASTAIDTLIAANNNGQSLGLFTANGAVILKPASSGQNLEIDASIVTTAASDASSSCTQSYICNGTISIAANKTIGTFTIVGGRIQYKAQVINSGTIGTRNILFDRRYAAANGFAPPFFPSTTVNTVPSGSESNSLYGTPSIQRTRWVSRMSY